MDLADFRKESSGRGLQRDAKAADPIDPFHGWFAQAIEMKLYEPNAVTLATVDEKGAPWQRTVLLKNFDAEGLCFYTNHQNRMASHISGNARVSLLFPWITLERQVIVRGIAVKTSAAEFEINPEKVRSRCRHSGRLSGGAGDDGVLARRPRVVARPVFLQPGRRRMGDGSPVALRRGKKISIC